MDDEEDNEKTKIENEEETIQIPEENQLDL